MRKNNQKTRSTSVQRKILVPTFFMLAALLAILIGGFLGSGLLQNLNENAFSVLNERVSTRATYLTTNMLNRWNKLELLVEQVNATFAQLQESGEIDLESIDTDPKQYNLLLEKAAPLLISTMRTNATNGAFLLLNTHSIDGDITQKKEQRPGLYIRDLDPVSSYGSSNGDLLLEYAPTEVVSKLGISTDAGWKPLLTMEKGKEVPEWLYHPYQVAINNRHLNAQDMGHWSEPYQLQDSGRWSMAYSIPLISEDGEFYGVVGVEILLDYLQQLLPSTDLSSEMEGAYVLGIESGSTEDGSLQVRTVASNGVAYTNFLTVKKELNFVSATETKSGYTISLGKEMYAGVQPLSLYNTNTPFANEK